MSQSKIPAGGKTGLRSSTPSGSPLTQPPSSRLSLPGKRGQTGRKPVPEKTLVSTPESLAETPSKDKEDGEGVELDLSTLPPTSSLSHRDLKKCPCGETGKGSWKIDCSQCKQEWHVECVSLNGLNKDMINRLVDYKCPFCYVAPIPTQLKDPGFCLHCRNTLTLQEANSQHEIALAAKKLGSVDELCTAVSKVNFEALTEQLNRIETADLRIQHLLLNEEALKELQNRGKNVEGTVLRMQDEITSLQKELQEVYDRPQPELKCSSALNEDIITTISDQLALLRAEEPTIAEKLDSLKSSVEALGLTTVSNPAPATAPSPESSSETSQPEDIEHGQSPIHSSVDDYITEDTINQLIDLFTERENDFKAEGGRAVLYFGEQYKYTGSTVSNSQYQAVPLVIGSLIQKINSEFCTENTPKVNSCLINRFEGPAGYLPKHSDNEPTIHPESQIITLSLGSECTLRFTDKKSGGIVQEHVAKHSSVYSMTRKSQDLFEHAIDQGSVSEGTRFSLTFRAISWRNRGATCIIGDSNTAGLKFGNDPKRSFGNALPGKRFAAPLISDINPCDTYGYTNVVIMAGINNLKSDSIKTPNDVRGVFNTLTSKISMIQNVNPKAHIFVCPVLPTKLQELNRKGMCFNRLIMNELIPSNYGASFLDGFQNFLDENGLLSHDLSRERNKNGRLDFLHLNWKGLAKLGSLIKNTVLLRKSGGVDKRKTRRVDGTSYRDVAVSRSIQHDGSSS